MARQRILLTDFSRGMVSRKVMGRLDTDLQAKGAEDISGFVLSPDGGVTRRRGTIDAKQGLGILPHNQGLYAEAAIPAFLIIRRGEVDSEAPWAIWIQDSPRAIKAYRLDTGAEQTISLTDTEAGEPMNSTGSFYAEPSADVTNQHILIWTPGYTFLLKLSNWSVTPYTGKDIGVVHQNRLIVSDRKWGDLYMSVPLDMFKWATTETVSIGTRHYSTVECLPNPENYGGSFFTIERHASDGHSGRVYVVWYDRESTNEDGPNTTVHKIPVQVTDGMTAQEVAEATAQALGAVTDIVVTRNAATLTFESAYAGGDIDVRDSATRTFFTFSNFSQDIEEKQNTGAIEFVPDYYGSEQVKWMIARQNVFLGTDAAEYVVTSAYPVFNNDPGGTQVQKISNVGTDGAAFFGGSLVLRQGERLIRTAGDGNGASMTEYLGNAKIIRHVSMDYGSHRYLLALDITGTLYCYTEAQANGVAGWTKLASEVGWIDAYEHDLYIAQADSGSYYLRVLPIDSLFYPNGRDEKYAEAFAATKAYGNGSGYLKVNDVGSVGDTLPPSTTVEVYKLEAGEMSYVSAMATNSSGQIDDTLTNLQDAVGYTTTPVYIFAYEQGETFASQVKTLPVHIPSRLGASLGTIKNVNGITVVVHDSTALRARANGGPWESWSETDLYTGPVNLRLEGLSGETAQVEIQAVDEKPLTIMAVQLDVTVGEL